MKTLRFIILASCNLLIASNISILVTDPHQRAIPGATVTLTSPTSEVQALTTDGTGRCAFTSVASGQYFIEASAPGFDASRPRSIAVQDSFPTDLAFSLGVAEVRASVVVTASG